MGLLALRPGDLFTIPKLALSIGYRSSVSFLSAPGLAERLRPLRNDLTPYGAKYAEQSRIS